MPRTKAPRDPNGPKTSKAQLLAVQKYMSSHIKSVTLHVPVADFELIESAAKDAGESRHGFIMKAIRERVERLKAEQTE